MDATAIVNRLKEKFGDAIGALTTENPDPFVVVDRKALVEICKFLKTDPDLELDFLVSISGLDLKEKMVAVYHLWGYKHRHGMVLKVECPPTDLVLPSVTSVWRAANWHEREQFDLFGFTFTGHPDLRRLLLPEDWVGHPLQKSYVYPTQYHGIDHYRPNPFDQFKAKDEADAKARAPSAPAEPTPGSTPATN
ncbi:MAG: NADH-quinone oxidoreductase subunit C [Deltaproteobacteria bacterium]|nr:NADH-quinone oxidoreductase subunit C [Deltaproteobacteria bacterium]